MFINVLNIQEYSPNAYGFIDRKEGKMDGKGRTSRDFRLPISMIYLELGNLEKSFRKNRHNPSTPVDSIPDAPMMSVEE